MAEITDAGFYECMPEADYHAHPAISKTGLDLIARSPAHFYHAPPREPTRAMSIGSAIHCALLEPERFQRDYITLPGIRDRRAGEYKQAVKARGTDATVLIEPEADKIIGMQASIYAQPHARAILETAGRREVSAFVTDREFGIGMRCRFDLLTDDGRAVDLKKTQDARPEAFARSVANYRYHVQAAMYSDVYYQLTGRRLQAFGFLAVEEEPPHPAMIYVLDDEAMAEGYRLYRRDLETYARCAAVGEWPAYGDEVQVLSLPKWATKEAE